MGVKVWKGFDETSDYRFDSFSQFNSHSNTNSNPCRIGRLFRIQSSPSCGLGFGCERVLQAFIFIQARIINQSPSIRGLRKSPDHYQIVFFFLDSFFYSNISQVDIAYLIGFRITFFLYFPLLKITKTDVKKQL